jgi:hypothetical protein
MNHSLYDADRATHLKIVVVALAGAIAITASALSLHIKPDTASVASAAPVMAGKPMTMSSSAVTIIP